MFERFLDENRREAPDIDIDFCKDRRGEVIQYVKDKYGEANVAQIGTFGTLAARAAIRDVGRTLGMPIFRVDQIVAMVPDQLDITLDDALEQSDDLRQAYDSNGEVRELIDLATKIEGLARNVGTHAAAVVIAERPVDQYVPLQHVKGKTEVITQWAMGDVERAGLLEDGLPRPAEPHDPRQEHRAGRSSRAASRSIRTSSRSTTRRRSRCLCRGETKGIFQLESGGIRDLLQRMKPDHFRDIIATNALYRPGPLEGGMVDEYIEVKHGRRPASYPHPVMREVLEETHGVMVYQEQVMRILNLLGGIPLADAYTCIKAISKKKLPMIAKYREEFIDGARREGPRKEEGRRPVQHDREVRRLRLQQVAQHRVRADRLSDRLLEGALSGRVHGGAALGRHPGAQLQEQGLARRASGRLQADGRRGGAAGREHVGRGFRGGRRGGSRSA